MDLIAVEPFDGNVPGQKIRDVPQPRARQLIEKGLAKAAPAHKNKMAERSENKANPSPAAGKARQSSSSQAARASAAKTSSSSARGARKAPAKKAVTKRATKKRRGRSSR